jgi:hypothetical protein
MSVSRKRLKLSYLHSSVSGLSRCKQPTQYVTGVALCRAESATGISKLPCAARGRSVKLRLNLIGLARRAPSQTLGRGSEVRTSVEQGGSFSVP